MFWLLITSLKVIWTTILRSLTTSSFRFTIWSTDTLELETFSITAFLISSSLSNDTFRFPTGSILKSTILFWLSLSTVSYILMTDPMSFMKGLFSFVLTMSLYIPWRKTKTLWLRSYTCSIETMLVIPSITSLLIMSFLTYTFRFIWSIESTNTWFLMWFLIVT